MVHVILNKFITSSFSWHAQLNYFSYADSLNAARGSITKSTTARQISDVL